jgi:plasmid stabilization system protein ParE
MSGSYRISPRAEADVDEQAGYLVDRGGLDLGLRFYDAVRQSLRELASAPGIGELSGYADPRLEGVRLFRVSGFEKHLIVYQYDGELLVLRVLHGARDLRRLLDRP